MAGSNGTACPRCVRGTVTGPNGELWRCAFCGGTGTAAYSDADFHDRVSDARAENFGELPDDFPQALGAISPAGRRARPASPPAGVTASSQAVAPCGNHDDLRRGA